MERVDIDRYLRFDILTGDEFCQLVDSVRIRRGGLIGVEYLICIPDDEILLAGLIELIKGSEI